MEAVMSMRTLVGVAAIALTLPLGVSSAGAAPEPTLTDVAACNEQAAGRTGGSAMPHPGTTPPEAARPAPAPQPGSGSGIVPGPLDRGAASPPVAPLPPTPGPSTKTDPSGSVITQTPDPLLQGMDATKTDDPQYRAAYRDCMRARLGAR
jgi:hypothetical protein